MARGEGRGRGLIRGASWFKSSSWRKLLTQPRCNRIRYQNLIFQQQAEEEKIVYSSRSIRLAIFIPRCLGRHSERIPLRIGLPTTIPSRMHRIDNDFPRLNALWLRTDSVCGSSYRVKDTKHKPRSIHDSLYAGPGWYVSLDPVSNVSATRGGE